MRLKALACRDSKRRPWHPALSCLAQAPSKRDTPARDRKPHLSRHDAARVSGSTCTHRRAQPPIQGYLACLKRSCRILQTTALKRHQSRWPAKTSRQRTARSQQVIVLARLCNGHVCVWLGSSLRLHSPLGEGSRPPHSSQPLVFFLEENRC